MQIMQSCSGLIAHLQALLLGLLLRILKLAAPGDSGGVKAWV